MERMTTPIDDTPLKPCPFCGGAVKCVQHHALGSGCWIEHINRDCGVEYSSLEPNDPGLIATWNTRAESALERVANRLAEAANALMDSSGSNILEATDEDLREAAALVHDTDVANAAKAFLAARAALRDFEELRKP